MNVWTISGNLGKDCRVGEAGGTAVCNFTVAVKSGFGKNEQTLWVDCALWGKQAESKLPDYLLKGQKVVVSGELGTREYDKDGQTRTSLTMRVNSIDLAGGSDTGSTPAPSQPAPQRQAAAPQQAMPADYDIDDQIPF